MAVGGIHACTDVTGFGLLGHALEMAEGSNVTVQLNSAALPLMPGARDLAEMGIIPGGAYRNMDYVKAQLTHEADVPQELLDIMADPQTSGGLLLALPEEKVPELLDRLQEQAPWSAVVGRVTELQKTALHVI